MKVLLYVLSLTQAFIKLGATPVIDMCVNWLCDNGMKEIFMFYSKSKTEVE